VRSDPNGTYLSFLGCPNSSTLGNVQGQVEINAKISDRTQPGVLESRGIWPGTAFKGGTGINTLISAKSPYPNGGVAFHDCAVWMRVVS
jgi:anaerobic selenocysteine-containing dehydrogenase